MNYDEGNNIMKEIEKNKKGETGDKLLRCKVLQQKEKYFSQNVKFFAN